jgi:hypothetical protein
MTKTWTCKEVSYQTVDGSTATVSGVVTQDETGRLEVRVAAERAISFEMLPQPQVIRGITADGSLVTATDCWPTTYSYDSPGGATTIGFNASEVVITDPYDDGTWDEHRVYVKGTYWLGKPRFLDGDRKVELESMALNHHRRNEVSGIIKVTLPAPAIDDGEAILADVTALLTLAQRSPLAVIRVESSRGGRIAKTVLIPSPEVGPATHPLIPWTPSDLKHFFEQTLPQYRRHKTAYELPRLFAYYTRSFAEPVAELKFMTAGVFMEAFKFYWARNVAALSPKLKSNGLISNFIKSTAANGKQVTYSFEELLQLASHHLGYTTTFTFIDDRNAIFHTGAAAAAQQGHASVWPTLEPVLVKLYRQMDDIILRILGYAGPILPWDAADTVENFPRTTP